MFFKKNKESKENTDSFLEKTLNDFLLEDEEIVKTFGMIDKVYMTNKRIIFKDVNLSLKERKVLEIVFIDIKKIDGISYIETSDLVANRAIKIKTRGFEHDMKFNKKDKESAIEFCKYLSQKIFDLKNNNID